MDGGSGSDQPMPVTPADNGMQQSGGDHTASGATLPLLGLVFFGALSLVNAAAVFGNATETVTGYALAVMPLDGGPVLAAALLALVVIDLAIAWGLYHVRMWAWWAGFAAFTLHAVTGVLTNWLFPLLAFFAATGLLVERRAFRLAQ